MDYAFVSEDQNQLLRIIVTNDKLVSEYLILKPTMQDFELSEDQINPEGMKVLFSSLLSENLSQELKEKVLKIADVFDARFVKPSVRSKENEDISFGNEEEKISDEDNFIFSELQSFCEENEIDAQGVKFGDYNLCLEDEKGRMVFLAMEMSNNHDSLFLISKYKFFHPMGNVNLKRFQPENPTSESSAMAIKNLLTENLTEGNRIGALSILAQIQAEIPSVGTKPSVVARQSENKNNQDENKK